MDLIDRMLEHDRWATSLLLELSRDLTDDQLDRVFDIGHETLRATFDHMIFNVAGWTASMAGQVNDPDLLTHQSDRSVADLIDRHNRSYDTFAAVSRRVRDEQRLDDTFVDHFGERPTYGGSIAHIIMHNAEHRTEVLHILKRLGLEDLPEIDLLLWEHTVLNA